MRRGSHRLRLLLAAILLAAAWLSVAPASGQSPLENDVREIASGLRCPVCQNLSVADSPSEMAQQMRAVIRDRLVARQSRDEIEAYFVSKYGQWILLSPRRSGLNLLLWIGPFAAAVLGLLLAARFVGRWARRRARTSAPRVDPGVLERIRAEIAEDDAPPAVRQLVGMSPPERERARLYEALRELALDYRAGKLSSTDYEAVRAEYEARAATVLLELDAEARRARAAGARSRREGSTRNTRTPAKVPARRRLMRAASVGGFLLVFGVTLGAFLAQGIRPRGGSIDSITGDFLTGTGPGGVSPTLSFRGNAVERNLAEGREALAREDLRMAIDHFRSVLDVEPNNPTALSYLGLVLWRGGHAEPALETVERALSISPNHPVALWMKGLALYEGKGDYAGAIRSWEPLMEQRLAPADADTVARMLAEARQQLAARASGVPPPVTPRSMVSSEPQRLIAGTVALAEGLRDGAAFSGTLFVIARRGAGPPLAVKRIVEPVFPVPFTLGPEDSMLPGTDFAGEVTLVARLKRDGRASAAVRGDLEGAAPAPVPVGTTDARITLEVVR